MLKLPFKVLMLCNERKMIIQSIAFLTVIWLLNRVILNWHYLIESKIEIKYFQIKILTKKDALDDLPLASTKKTLKYDQFALHTPFKIRRL